MSFNRPDIIRPPSEGRSYYLPLTAGCSNNTCTFCQYYGAKLQLRDVEEVLEEIDALALFVKHGLRVPGIPDVVYWIASEWDGKGIFLQDADALVYPYDKLKRILEYINEKLPFVQRVAIYATAADVLRRTPEQLKTLNELKLGIAYMGLESGDDEILKRVDKQITSQEMIDAARMLKDAGMQTSIMVILGLGGAEMSEQHAHATIRVLNAMDPDYAGALTLLFTQGTPISKEMQEGTFHPISEFQSLKELLIMVENSDFTNCFFSSMHASNYLPLRGRLPQDKQKMIAQLKNVIDKGDQSMLRPESYRRL
ncbi:MAG: radical SAM protein [Dehalococcoidales bacterium]|nr:radical SAM protein [Dehalococcoidales bacterium]